ncbi:MarR family transcriptional regulator [Lusitaniella coriacea LEGE 07157]|uniref:MarR family transcriptional regulator n=1 Tax=Lusitaniella coriacea LEGE 07157 TaxID=945747 RepID=A0A8J7ISI0_9CYAN|nr:helix-turn-helix domain-containing protein [Lusitaniella coriacea]MBE9116177.1 MarR family transcriptional regulator [Lusitaniella coriacea LEGE 07157]
MNLFRQFKNWYLQYRGLFGTWISRDSKEPTPPEPTLAELPHAIAQRIKVKTQELPIPPAIATTVREAVNEALEEWQEQPVLATNSLVLLGNSVEPIARILSESLEELQDEIDIPIRLLQWVRRPADPNTLQEKLVAQLGRGLPIESKQQPEIVIIPNLSWCFLRSAEGLDGIEYLRDNVLSERSRFWIVGCSKIAWNYLNLVSKIEAYYQKQFFLDPLTGEQLQEWLTPIVEEVGIQFSKQQKQAESKEEESAKDIYFKQLAAVSEGISSVAVQLFLRSLFCNTPEEETDAESKEKTDTESEEENNTESEQIETKIPVLPSLPGLSPDDDYILYSLLLHGNLTLAHLAESLGDDRATVQSLVQILHRSGAIEEQNHRFQVNPLYYPKLKTELDGNNFLIAEDED